MARGYLTPWRDISAPARSWGGSLFDLHRQVNRLFDDVFDRQGDGGAFAQGGLAPALDIHRDDDKLEITAELPGVREEDIDLSVEDGVLTLRGEKRSTHTDEERGYSERSYGTFERRLTLPAGIDADACEAEFKDGVLTITMPKTETSRARRIPLRRSGERAARTIEAQNDRERMQQAASEAEDSGGQQG